MRRGTTFSALVLATPTLGAWRIAAVDARAEAAPHLKVGVVQGNYGIKTYSRGRLKRRLLTELQETTAQLESEGAEIALWGETAYPYSTFDRDATTDRPERDRRRIRRGFDIPVIVGMITRDRSRENPYPWNSNWKRSRTSRNFLIIAPLFLRFATTRMFPSDCKLPPTSKLI